MLHKDVVSPHEVYHNNYYVTPQQISLYFMLSRILCNYNQIYNNSESYVYGTVHHLYS